MSGLERSNQLVFHPQFKQSFFFKLPFSRVVVRVFGRFGYLASTAGKRNLWRGKSEGIGTGTHGRLGVIAVKKFPGLSVLRQ